MKLFSLIAAASLAASALASPAPAIADVASLDTRFHELKNYGSLTGFCLSNPNVVECLIGIGEWKSDILDKIKSVSIQCFDSCPEDTYGFVRPTLGNRDHPEVRTKDFDGNAASRGVEFRLYPLAFEILKYEGCAGCSLVKETPKEVYISYRGLSVQLPMLGYGVFYVPRYARRLALSAAETKQGIDVKLVFINKYEHRALSVRSVSEYARMLQSLDYSKIK